MYAHSCMYHTEDAAMNVVASPLHTLLGMLNTTAS
jgi:hypothetical protein